MSGAGIELTGIDATIAALSAAIARQEHPRAMFDEIGAALVVSTQRRFERGVAPDGNPWPPSLRARLTGGKTLVDTARLMQSITHNATDEQVEVGTNVIYAAIHQFGGDIQVPEHTQTIYRTYNARTDVLSHQFVRKDKATFAQDVQVGAHTITMPARPFLGLDQDDEQEIVAIAGIYMAGPERDEGEMPRAH